MTVPAGSPGGPLTGDETGSTPGYAADSVRRDTAAGAAARNGPGAHGRPPERGALLHTAGAHLGRGGSVLLTGPPGIGRTALLSRLATAFPQSPDDRVLRCAPSAGEQDSPFLGLIDLLSGVGEPAFAALTAHERTVLDRALLREPAAGAPADGYGYGYGEEAVPPGADGGGAGHARSSGPGAPGHDSGGDTGRDRLALRMAVRKVIGALAPHGRVLLVVDDLQWLDRPTADVLAFLARRAEGVPYAVLAAVRTEPWHLAEEDPEGPLDAFAPRPEALCPQPLRTLPVPPMTLRETAELLDGAEGLAWSQPLVARLHRAGGGVPRTVVELARALAEQTRGRGGLPAETAELPVPDSLRRPVIARLAPLPPGVRHTLLAASAAARPTVELLRRAGCATSAADLDAAARHGLVEPAAGHGAIRFTDPLVPVVLYGEAAYGTRIAVHRALAAAAEDPVEKAHHLASLAPERDAETAARLTEAAGAARRRGAAATAALLGRLAAERTPLEQRADGVERRLTAAQDAVAAGDFPLARRLAHDVLADAVDPAERVSAWNVVVDSCGQNMAEIADVFPQALRDARDDPGLLATLHYRLGWREWMVADSAGHARDHAARSAELAALAGDRHTEVLALTLQAALELFLGAPGAQDVLRRALEPPHDARAMADHNGPLYIKSHFHLVHDRLDEARTERRALAYTLRQRGSAESLGQCLCGLAQVEVLRGRCRQALTVARQSLRVAEQAGISQGPAWYTLSLAEAAGGSLDEALAAADKARQHSEDDDDHLFLPRALHAEGRIRLCRGEYRRAAEVLRRAGGMETRQGQADPAVRRWHGDLAEALARSGEPDEADEVIGRARTQAVRLGRSGVLAALDRSAAAVAESRGDLGTAAAGLRRSAERFRTLRYPLEEAATRLALGRVQRRRGDADGSRAELAEALRLFTRAGAHPWIALVRAERERGAADAAVSPPRAPGLWADRLTVTERSVVTCVAEGASNREIAARLVVSVKTVEAALTRAYRKLGVKSRVEVARLILSPRG